MEIYKIEVFSIVIFEFKIRIICWVTFIVHVIFILINYLCMATFGKLNFLWSITLRRIGSILRVTPIPGKIITGTLLTVLGSQVESIMVLFTLLARSTDGLPLSSSVQDGNVVSTV